MAPRSVDSEMSHLLPPADPKKKGWQRLAHRTLAHRLGGFEDREDRRGSLAQRLGDIVAGDPVGGEEGGDGALYGVDAAAVARAAPTVLLTQTVCGGCPPATSRARS